MSSFKYPKSLKLTIASPKEGVITQAFIDNHLDDHLIDSAVKLVIDRYGVVGVHQESKRHRQLHKPRVVPIFEQPPWQTGDQKAALERLLEQDREYSDKTKRRLQGYVNRPPWEYPT